MTKAREKPPAAKRAKILSLSSPGRLRDDSDSNRDLLRRKNARLRQKYLKAIDKLQRISHKRLAAFQLGWWALQSRSAALALVRGGKIAICNARFHELNRASDQIGWRRVDATGVDGDATFPTLWGLVSREASQIFQTGPQTTTRRYKRLDKDEFIEANLQRSSVGPEPAHVSVLIYDVTERVRAERELDQLRESLVRQERLRAIGELASGVAHDLNNTLHAMSLRLSLLEQSPICQAEQGDNIRALSRIISDAALVVGRLQDFARQRQERPLESVDIATVVSEAIEIVRTGIEGQSSLEGAPIRIETALTSLPPVPGLASDLRHVVVNLLLNARDAMPRGGTIRLQGDVIASRVVLKVIDEGRGIAPDDLPKIFDPFFTTKGNRGTGLGLSMAYGVLTRLGGEISAANRPEGGACFTLTFPISSRPSDHPRAAPRSNPPTGRRILIVDDDLDNLEATRMVMEFDGQSVDVAKSGPEAIQMMRGGERYDLVLCDLGMPDMNGWRVAREIQDVAPGTAVYMLTGWAQEIADDDPRRKWVRGVLEKPMSLGHLRDLLASELVDSGTDGGEAVTG